MPRGVQLNMIRSVCALLVLCSAVAVAQPTPPQNMSKEALSAERMEIYRDFLHGYNNGSNSVLNVSQLTIAFSPDESDQKGCLSKFSAKDLVTPAVHTFSGDAFPGLAVRLVDPKTHKGKDPGDAIRGGASVDDAVKAGFAAGLFTFSEIAFDADHTHAAFSFSFWCGSLCGHGGVIIYELSNGKWKQSKAQCGRWIS